MVLAQTVILRVVWRVYGNTLGQMPSPSSSWKRWTGSLNAPRTLTSSLHRSISNLNRLVALQLTTSVVFFFTYSKYTQIVHAMLKQAHTQKNAFVTNIPKPYPEAKANYTNAWDGRALDYNQACIMLEGSPGKLPHIIDFVMKNTFLVSPIIENNSKTTWN